MTEKTRGVEIGLRGQDRRKARSPDAGDRIVAREQPEVGEVGKIRCTLSPLLLAQRSRFVVSVRSLTVFHGFNVNSVSIRLRFFSFLSLSLSLFFCFLNKVVVISDRKCTSLHFILLIAEWRLLVERSFLELSLNDGIELEEVDDLSHSRISESGTYSALDFAFNVAAAAAAVIAMDV